MYQLGPAEIHYVVDLLICLLPRQLPQTIHRCASIAPVHAYCTLAQYWVGEARAEEILACQAGHYMTATMEMHGQIVVRSVLQLQK